jgi:putative MATE family efflux protein
MNGPGAARSRTRQVTRQASVQSNRESNLPRDVFTRGSTLRHVAVMTATGSIGLTALFIVDFLNLFYISLLGERELAAAIGYAGTIQFFASSFCIGVAIAGSALVSRSLGARRHDESRRIATSSLVFMAATSGALAVVTLMFLGPILTLLGATGRTLDVAWRFLLIVTPSTPLLGLGLAVTGLLRAAGDARRSMYAKLGAGLVTAAFDPLFIFGFGLGVDGAAIVSVISRLALVAISLYGSIMVHDLLARPSISSATEDSGQISAIAIPAVLANIATPISDGVVTAAIARYGDSAIAGYAIIGRITPVVLAAIFALAGSIGPILGQNLGARRFARVRRALTDSLVLTVIYCVAIWILLAMLQDQIVRLFGAAGEGAALIHFFCSYVAGSFVFLAAYFVANAAFNNLGFSKLSMAFNWGRATLGTIPFVWIGAMSLSAPGVIAGQAAGSAVFGVMSIVVCYRVVRRVAKQHRIEATASASAT